MTAPQPIAPERLIDFAAAVYSALGVPDPDARLLADALVCADLWGHQSHGVLRLSWHPKRIESGVMKAKTPPELVVDADALEARNEQKNRKR